MGEAFVSRRNVDFQIFYALFGFCAGVDLRPDARFVDYFAAAVMRAAAGAISHSFGAGLRADVFHVAEDAIAAGLAAEERGFNCEFESLYATG